MKKSSSHVTKVKKNKSRKNSHMSATSSDHHDMEVVGSPNGSVSRSKNPSPIPGHSYHSYRSYERYIDWIFSRLKLIFILSYQLFTDWFLIFKSILVFIRSDVTTKTLTTSIILWSQAPCHHASKSFLTKKSQRRSKFFQLHTTYFSLSFRFCF